MSFLAPWMHVFLHVKQLNWHDKGSCLYFVAIDAPRGWCLSVLVIDKLIIKCRAFSGSVKSYEGCIFKLNGILKHSLPKQGWSKQCFHSFFCDVISQLTILQWNFGQNLLLLSFAMHYWIYSVTLVFWLFLIYLFFVLFQ